MSKCVAGYLGLMPYGPALKLQQQFAQARAEGAIPDVLLLLQHPPVFTIGRFHGESEITASPETLRQEGIDIFHADRGGSVTYHGPRQLVGYPILNLKELKLGVRDYVWKLEEIIIRLLGDFGINGGRNAKYPGVWVGDEKIGSIGIKVSRHITMHGFALNVNTNLKHFDYINPCGIRGAITTSITRVLGHMVDVETSLTPLLRHFSAVLGVNCIRDDSLAQTLFRDVLSLV